MYQQISGTDLMVSRIVYGCMTLPVDPRAALNALRAALDCGITMFDHADVYQRGAAEAMFAAIWRDEPGLRQRIVLQSKCGIRQAGDPTAQDPKRYDLSREHILRAVEGSLQRLATDYLDILVLHRPDALVEPDEVAEAFTRLTAAGKVRYFGVSNHNGAQIELLRRAIGAPLIVNQLQFSVLHSHLVNAGIVTNQNDPPHAVRGDGTLEYCRAHDITIQAWSPLARGQVSGHLPADADERTRRTAALVAELAAQHRVAPEAIVLAWVLRHPARMQAVIGTTDPARIAACVAALGVTLSREEWYRLFTTGRGVEIR